ncbi:MAG: YwiC-like family protein [Candidatus Carbobacillus sp.]|nr:YwiC-like family protein [Candidatus Carbobacillus sp.]
MKLVLPKEHGTWMMLFLPYLLGVVLSGPTLAHIPFLIGWFFLYLSSTPWLNQIRNAKLRKQMRPWALAYTAIGLIFLLPLVGRYPPLFFLGLAIIPFFAVNLFFIVRKKERHLLNDISGIVIFCLGLPAAYVLGKSGLTVEAGQMSALVFFYFTGSAFFVKSLIRERKNRSFKITSHLYHTALLILPWLLGKGAFAWAYVPGVIKDWVTPRSKPVRPITIGIIEIINGIIFFILAVIIDKLAFF